MTTEMQACMTISNLLFSVVNYRKLKHYIMDKNATRSNNFRDHFNAVIVQHKRFMFFCVICYFLMNKY